MEAKVMSYTQEEFKAMSDEKFMELWESAKSTYEEYQLDKEDRYQKMCLSSIPEGDIIDLIEHGKKTGLLKGMSKKLMLMIPTLIAFTATPTFAATVEYVSRSGGSVNNAMSDAQQIREAFEQLLEVATAIAEPILWIYALTACILMATGKNKEIGWNRLKNVGYSYVVIALMPTGFAFLRWIANIIKNGVSF